MQILDLRQVSSRSLEPLFVEEARQWRDELHWDYRPSLELIRKFIDSRALRGAVVMEDDRPAGYGFYVLEERKGLIGGLFVAPHASEPEITRALLQEMLETLWATPRIERVSFWLTGTRHYRNADKVVHLYNYLLAGARKAAGESYEEADEPILIDTRAMADSELIGPLEVASPLTLSASDGHQMVDADGFSIIGTVEPGTEFYLRRAPGTTAATLTATTPRDVHGRVLTGVALDGAAQRFTPVALAIPTEMAIEFDIRWDAEKP